MVYDKSVYAWDPRGPVRSKISRELSDIPGKVKQARQIVERLAGALTLGERMLLYQCVRESAKSLKEVTRLQDIFDLEREAASRFWYRYKSMYL